MTVGEDEFVVSFFSCCLILPDKPLHDAGSDVVPHELVEERGERGFGGERFHEKDPQAFYALRVSGGAAGNRTQVQESLQVTSTCVVGAFLPCGSRPSLRPSTGSLVIQSLEFSRAARDISAPYPCVFGNRPPTQGPWG